MPKKELVRSALEAVEVLNPKHFVLERVPKLRDSNEERSGMVLSSTSGNLPSEPVRCLSMSRPPRRSIWRRYKVRQRVVFRIQDLIEYAERRYITPVVEVAFHLPCTHEHHALHDCVKES